MYKISARADFINAHAKGDAYVRSCVEREWNRKLERTLLPSLSPSALRCLLSIKSRTLGWMKYAEAISMPHFIHGLADGAGDLLLDEDDRPFFAGSGIAKEDSVRAAIKSLEHSGLITKMTGIRNPGTGTNIYMPFSEEWLADTMIDAGAGALPKGFGSQFWVSGEHVQTIDGRFWQIVDAKDAAVTVVAVVSPEARRGPEVKLHWLEIGRPEFHEWMAFKKGESSSGGLPHDYRPLLDLEGSPLEISPPLFRGGTPPHLLGCPPPHH